LFAQRSRNIAHPQEVAHRHEPLAGSQRMRHRADMQVDQIADIDDLQAEARIGRHLTLQQADDDFGRAGAVRRQDRTEDRAGQHRRQARRSLAALHEFPRGTFRQTLGMTIWVHRFIGIEPNCFVADAIRRAHRRCRGCCRRSHDDTFCSRCSGRA
jgi:hypothetical protein